MLGREKIMAFIPSSDLTRSRRFYESKLGISVLDADNFALTLDANGTMVRVTNVGEFTPQKFTLFGWEIADIERTVADLKNLGIDLQHYGLPNQDDSGIWTSPSGARIAWFHDPDGNILSVTQFTASRQ